MREKAIKWINSRLVYIATNCDLKQEDNKLAFDSLKYAKDCINKIAGENLKIGGLK